LQPVLPGFDETISMGMIFKICSRTLWEAAQRAGRFTGAPVDLADGFIHFSTGSQVRETARRHFAGESDLMLVAIAGDVLGDALRFEPSRGGDLFPHLYGDLAMSAVRGVAALPLSPDGGHIFPTTPPFDGIAA
jgi:uncharacterized protein (DUF952 family)